MLFIDEYSIIHTEYIVQALPVNLVGETETDEDVYVIALILHVGKKAFRSTLEYPSRRHRDAAFEGLSAAMQQPPRQVSGHCDA
jgi:hypothetical protein